MAQAGCFGARNLVAIRAARVETDGRRICPNIEGAAAMTGGAISFSASLTIDAGQTDLQRDGDGNVCNTRTSPDLITGVDLNLELCILDFEMIEQLTGGVIAIDVGKTHGWEYAKSSDLAPHSEFHGWSRTWSGTSTPTNVAYAYTQVAFYNTTWVPGQITFQENALSFPLTGKGVENPNISIGSFNDIPTEFVGSVGGIWLTPASKLPANPNAGGLSCGYVNVPACAGS